MEDVNAVVSVNLGVTPQLHNASSDMSLPALSVHRICLPRQGIWCTLRQTFNNTEYTQQNALILFFNTYSINVSRKLLLKLISNIYLQSKINLQTIFHESLPSSLSCFPFCRLIRTILLFKGVQLYSYFYLLLLLF